MAAEGCPAWTRSCASATTASGERRSSTIDWVDDDLDEGLPEAAASAPGLDAGLARARQPLPQRRRRPLVAALLEEGLNPPSQLGGVLRGWDRLAKRDLDPVALRQQLAVQALRPEAARRHRLGGAAEPDRDHRHLVAAGQHRC